MIFAVLAEFRAPRRKVVPAILGSFWFCFAGMAMSHGLSQDRLHEIDHALEQAPGNARLLAKRGRLHRDAGRWQAAIADFQQARQHDPRDDAALYWLADSVFLSGDPARAQAIAQAYVSRVPTAAAGHRLLAQISTALEDYDMAANQFDQAIRHDAMAPPQLYLERAHVLGLMTPRPTHRISAGLLAGLKTYPGNAVLLTELINTHAANHNYSHALALFDQLPTALAKTPLWLNRQARLELRRGDLAAARQLYRESLSRIAALPERRQALPVFVAARETAEASLKANPPLSADD